MTDEKEADKTANAVEEHAEAATAGAVATKHSHKGHHHAHGEAHEEEFEFVEDPVFDIDYKGDCSYEVNVSVSVANEAKEAEHVLDELVKEAEVPGFRRGRAPRKLLERKLSKAIRSDVTEKMVSASFKKLIKDKELKALASPAVDGLDKDADRKEGDPLTFTLKFEVQPRVELGKYRGVEIERPVVLVDDKDVDEAIEQIRQGLAIYEEMPESEVAADGDQVVIDFDGMIDDKEFTGGSAKAYPYILGSKRILPEFEQVLLGSKKGQELACNVTFEAGHSKADLAGKTAAFKISVKAIKRKIAPELGDDFAKQRGFENMAEMKEKVTRELQESCEAQSDRLARASAMRQVIDAATFEIPKSLLASVADEMKDSMLKDLYHQRVPTSDIEARMTDIDEKCNAEAQLMMRQLLVINEIGEAEGIEVTEEDFEREIEREARTVGERYNVDVDTVSRIVRSDDKFTSNLESRLFREKTMEAIMTHAIVKNKEVTRDELEGSEQGQV